MQHCPRVCNRAPCEAPSGHQVARGRRSKPDHNLNLNHRSFAFPPSRQSTLQTHAARAPASNGPPWLSAYPKHRSCGRSESSHARDSCGFWQRRTSMRLARWWRSCVWWLCVRRRVVLRGRCRCSAVPRGWRTARFNSSIGRQRFLTMIIDVSTMRYCFHSYCSSICASELSLSTCYMVAVELSMEHHATRLVLLHHMERHEAPIKYCI